MFKTERPIASTKEDLLGRSNTARELGRHILEYKDEDSLTIGIIGNWGSGKTSFINMCLEDIKNNEDYIIIYFNPWNISTRKQLISDFFMQLANEIKSDSEKDAEDAAIKAGNNLKLLSKFFKPVSNLNIPLVSSVATILNSTCEGAAEYLKDYIKLQEMDLDSLKKQLNNSLEELNKKVIIVIDDIDRLSDDEIREIFQLVKSIADFKNTIYLLSYDEDIVSGALDDLQNGRGKEYLEKIVQVPIQLPYIGKEEINKIFIEKLVKTLQISKEDFYRTYFDTICWNGFQNNMESMRDVERYMNAFKFRMNFAKQELNIYDYMVITLFKVFEPPLFKYIQEHPDLFADVTLGREDISDTPEERAFVKKCIDEQINSLHKLNSIKVRKLIYVIFPKVRMLYQGSTPNETFLSPWNKERRITSPDYFKNYFSLEFSSTQINRETLEKIVNFKSKEDLIQSFNIEPPQRLRLLSALSSWIDEIKKDKRVEFLYFLLGIEDTFKPKEPNTFNYYLHNPLFYISLIYEQLMRGISFRENYDLIKVIFKDKSCSLKGLFYILKKINGDIEAYDLDSSQFEELLNTLITQTIKDSENNDFIPKSFLEILCHIKDLGRLEDSRIIFNNYLNNKKLLIPLVEAFVIYRPKGPGYIKTIVRSDVELFCDYNELLKLVDKNILTPTEEEIEIINCLKNPSKRNF